MASQSDYSYYASKADLLQWVNGVLQLQLAKLEQVIHFSPSPAVTLLGRTYQALLPGCPQFANGAVFCQLMDAFYHNSLSIQKVLCKLWDPSIGRAFIYCPPPPARPD